MFFKRTEMEMPTSENIFGVPMGKIGLSETNFAISYWNIHRKYFRLNIFLVYIERTKKSMKWVQTTGNFYERIIINFGIIYTPTKEKKKTFIVKTRKIFFFVLEVWVVALWVASVNVVGWKCEKIFHKSLLHLNILHGFCGWFAPPWINFLTASNMFLFLLIVHVSTIHILSYKKGYAAKKNLSWIPSTNHPWWKSRFNARLTIRVFHVVLFVMCEGKLFQFQTTSKHYKQEAI